MNIEELLLMWHVVRTFRKSRKTYGARRVSEALRADGIPVGRAMAATLMKKAEIETLKKKKFKVTTDSTHTHAVDENLLNRAFDVKETDTVWCSVITYLLTQEGWMYLAVVIDLASRRVVGWSIAKRMKKQLVIDALRSAFIARRPPNGLMFHSDRGSQYASKVYRKQLKR